MNKQDLLFAIYFINDLEKRDLESLIINIEEFIKQNIGIGISKISFGYSENFKPKSNNFKFSNKNLKQIYKQDKLENIYAYKVADNWGYKTKDFDVYFSYNKKGEVYEFSSVQIQLDLSFINNSELDLNYKDFIVHIINFIYEKVDKILYGINFIMEREKFPLFFANGIGSNDLTDEERKNAYTWSSHKEQCENKIRDIYWANIVTDRHLNDDKLFKKLIKIIGEENIIQIVKGLYIFYIPIDIFNYEDNKKKFEKYRKKLRKLFEKHDLIIKST